MRCPTDDGGAFRRRDLFRRRGSCGGTGGSQVQTGEVWGWCGRGSGSSSQVQTGEAWNSVAIRQDQEFSVGLCCGGREGYGWRGRCGCCGWCGGRGGRGGWRGGRGGRCVCGGCRRAGWLGERRGRGKISSRSGLGFFGPPKPRPTVRQLCWGLLLREGDAAIRCDWVDWALDRNGPPTGRRRARRWVSSGRRSRRPCRSRLGGLLSLGGPPPLA